MEDNRVIIRIEGGLVSDVFTNILDLSCDVLDEDVMDDDYEAERLLLRNEAKTLSSREREWLVVIRQAFIRDVQVAPDKYIDDILVDKDESQIDYNWSDIEGDLSIGIYKGKNKEDVLKEASKTYYVNKKALEAYELR